MSLAFLFWNSLRCQYEQQAEHSLSLLTPFSVFIGRGGFGRGRGDRGRGRGRGRGRPRDDDKEWVPVTKLGRLVKENKIKSLEDIYLFSMAIKGELSPILFGGASTFSSRPLL